METKVLFQAYQEVPNTDLNAIQDLTQSSIDNIVRYTLFDNRKYYGLNTTKSSAYQVTVAAGKGFYLGRVFAKSEETSHSLATQAPSAGQRIILAVISLDTVATGQSVRKFLVDATTRQTQPKAVATREARVASVDFISGTQAGSPVDPAVPSGYLAFARITMNSSGIVDVEMITQNEVTKLEDAIDMLNDVNDILDKHNAQFRTLKNDLAAIRNDIKMMPAAKDLESIQVQLMNLREVTDVSDMYSMYGMDDFNSDSESQTSDPAYDALIYRGLHFAPANEIVKVPKLQTTNDPTLLIDSSGLVLPKPSTVLAARIGNAIKRIGPQSDCVITNYASNSRSFKLQTPARNYWYYGTGTHAQDEEKLRNLSAVKLFNPITKAYETVVLKGRSWKLETINKVAHFYRIVSDEPYWDIALTGELVGSRHVAQTWYEPVGGWFTEMDIGVTQKDASANLRLYVTEVAEDGTPLDDRAIATTTIAAADVKVWTGSTAVWTTAKFSPFYVNPGRRYAVWISTAGDYRFATGNDDLGDKNEVSRSGTMWSSTDGITLNIVQENDLCLRARALQWVKTTTYMSLDGIDLSGGINRLQAVLTGYEPSGCNVALQAQVDGKWREVGEKDATVFVTNPSVLPLRLMVTGTTSQQPGIWLNQSAMIAQKPKLTSTHISTTRAPETNANKVIVTQTSSDFEEAKHDWVVKLKIGGGTYATEVAHSKVTTSVSKAGTTTRQWTFTTSNLNAFRIKTSMVTNNASDTFSISNRIDRSFA